MRLLIVEDNARFGQLLADHLKATGFTVDLARTARDFRELADRGRHDLLLIDLALPDGDGVDLVREIRRKGSSVPVLVLTARASVGDRIAGLDAGADDYLVKPFNVSELDARVRALLRRPANIAPQFLRAGALRLDAATGAVYCNGQRLNLRPSEQRLLGLLIRRSGRVVTREVIESAIHSVESESTPNALEKLVSRLRKTLSDQATGIELKTVKGLGYVLEEVS
ncbi:MAG: response regulator transcription factor [Pseudomonadota bacterium]